MIHSKSGQTKQRYQVVRQYMEVQVENARWNQTALLTPQINITVSFDFSHSEKKDARNLIKYVRFIRTRNEANIK